METRPFGWTGEQVSVIGQGTWNMERDDRALAIAALRRGIDLGMTHIDTAEMYGGGLVEELVGEAIADRRDRVFLVSKVLPSNASSKGTVAACERSLRRLKTDQLDVYLLHWPGSYPLEDTFAAFERLVEAGKIRYFGVSNFDVSDLEHAARIKAAHRSACNQVLYHLKERSIEHEVVPTCERHSMAVVAYSPFGSGNFPARGPGRAALDAIASEQGATVRQVALQFLVRRPSFFAIPKASRPEHAEENAGAGNVHLTRDDIASIEKVFPLGRPRGLPTL